jgi:DMSO/TMAO reductase YedYZ heme-binding membrane subunit
VNPQLWWYLARASGVTAWFLLALAVRWGLLLSTRLLGRKPTPAWLLDLHRFLGGLAVVFTALHLVGLVADSYTHFGLADLVVPMASSWKPGAVAWGIVAFYLLAAIEITSLLMKRMSRRWWRRVHSMSYLLFWVAAIHTATAGTDASNPALVVANAIAVLAVLTLTLVRVLTSKHERAATRKARGDDHQPRDDGLVPGDALA